MICSDEKPRFLELDTALIERTKGFLDAEEGRRLFDVALCASRLGPCLEIGSYCGKSTIYLGTACRANNSVLFAVDPHSSSEEQQPGEDILIRAPGTSAGAGWTRSRCFQKLLRTQALKIR